MHRNNEVSAGMLACQTTRAVFFDNLLSVNPYFGNMLPADLDGPPPPAGTPNYFFLSVTLTGSPN